MFFHVQVLLMIFFKIALDKKRGFKKKLQDFSKKKKRKKKRGNYRSVNSLIPDLGLYSSSAIWGVWATPTTSIFQNNDFIPKKLVR